VLVFTRRPDFLHRCEWGGLEAHRPPSVASAAVRWNQRCNAQVAMATQRTAEQGRVWFVTGTSSGFGRSVCEAVLARGERLVATGRDLDRIRPLVASAGDRALALRLDVTNATAAREAAEEAVARFGRIDVVVNNAGYGSVGAVEELTDDELREQLDVNLFGVINVTRAALPHMRRKRSGHLIQMSSLNGVEGLPGGAYYVASKFAIEGFSESLAAEVAHLGIKVTIIEPGPARTSFLSKRSVKWAKAIPDYAETVGKTREQLQELDGNQPVDPERVARAILRIVDAPQPPLRLPLGRMALEHIPGALRQELAELARWEELSATADFDAPPRPSPAS
jgi:NAD(P)-dependent dehydrogenase (short-subunit alcohol dehydrogenase family)